MNIGYVKLGKKIKLKEKHGIGNGDFDVLMMLKLLSLHRPNDRILLIGENDLDALSSDEYRALFPNQNVEKWVRGQRILDFTISLVGPHISDEITQPQIIGLNLSEKVIEIVHDKRFSSVEFEKHGLEKFPNVSLGQGLYSRYTSKNYCVRTKYAYQEILYLFEKEYQELNEEEFMDTFSQKTDLLVIAMKEIGSNWREIELEKYVFSQDLDFHLWGTLENDNYKGSYQMADLPKLCKNYKTSFCVPIVPDFVTSKYIELLHNNCFPFLHPEYGTAMIDHKHRVHRIKHVQDLTDQLRLLKNNPKTYFQILKNYKNILNVPRYYSGEFLANIIGEVIEDNA